MEMVSEPRRLKEVWITGNLAFIGHKRVDINCRALVQYVLKLLPLGLSLVVWLISSVLRHGTPEPSRKRRT